ncbi:hypothetical protein DFJ67_2751 [Asanoa ferruginea]|uniref:Uncharacterized protein n=1 Tax=Asanoa ferruginea TaxID=53367 RepID=A0A3D9ZSW5_9ACTN|nr:hypothetical protein [Asanoa ferruginea]REF96760.1 hypothetical protein DFJ67_2751 [Asanoa ferruginea]GIF53382.1 hypothetical protein Afe04nite_79210 [Asanoa ferruginea]
MKRLIATSPAVLGGIAAVTLVAGAGAAIAAWRVQSEEVVLTAGTATLSQGNKPVVAAKGNLVTVSWTPNTFGERKVDSYRIKRYDLSGTAQQPHGGCEENVAKETCTDAQVPVGSWRYTVVPVKAGWTGPESEKSDAVLVAADGKVVVIPAPLVDKAAGPAAGPAVVQLGDPADPAVATTDLANQPPAWTLQPGADGVLGKDDTLTYGGSAAVDPKTIIKDWDGKARDVTVAAKAADPGHSAVLTVDDGTTRVFGPLAVPDSTVAADTTFTATLAAVDGRIVVTLGAPQVAPAPDEAAPAPAQPTETSPGQPVQEPETTAPAEPPSQEAPAPTESAGSGTESEPAGPPASDGGGATEGEPDTPLTDTSATGTPPAAEVTPTATGDPAVVLVSA